MADAHSKNHDYHIIDPSPWPLIGSAGALLMAIGGGLSLSDRRFRVAAGARRAAPVPAE